LLPAPSAWIIDERAMKPTRPSAKYLARAHALAEAIDIAIQIRLPNSAALRIKLEALSVDDLFKEFGLYSAILKDRRPTEEEENRYRLSNYLWTKKSVLGPEPPFSNLRSLAYHEEAILTEWNEGIGPAVERFWQLIAERGSRFERRDMIRDILSRGRIRNDIEYHAVTDGIVILEQIGKISSDEVQKLSDMLAAFEKRARR
jgi:hypothetical protein